MKNTEYEQIALDTMQPAAEVVASSPYTQAILNRIAHLESILPPAADEITIASPYVLAVLNKIAKLESLLLRPTA